MGLFKKISDTFSKKKNASQDETGEENKELQPILQVDHDPKGKPLDWFSSKEGMEALKEYTSVKSFMLQERYKKEYLGDEFWRKRTFTFYLSQSYKNEMLPLIYFEWLTTVVSRANELSYCREGDDILKDALCLQAQPFTLDEDGEPQPKNPIYSLDEIVSTEKNPLLYFYSKFKLFTFENDDQGSEEDKSKVYTIIMQFIANQCIFDKDIISKNRWIFEENTYFNEMGIVRKVKGFLKKCAELSVNNSQYFHDLLENLG